MLRTRFYLTRSQLNSGVRRTTSFVDRMPLESQWDESLDAIVAAPAQHRVLFENAHVRVLDTRIAPGEQTPIHTHCWPASHYVVSWSDFVRRDAAGVVLVDTRTAGMRSVPEALWGESLPPHSLENVGTRVLHVVSTEVKLSKLSP